MIKKETITKEKFIEQYVDYVVNARMCMEVNDYRKNNILVKQFNTFLSTYEKEEYFEEAMRELMDNNRINVKVSAAVDALRHNIHIKRSLNTLKKVAKMDYKFDSLEAEMALKLYYGKIPNRKL